MAEITPTITPSSSEGLTVKWEGLGDDDTGLEIGLSGFTKNTVNIAGTFGSATIVVQGRNDTSESWATLNDTANAALSFTAASGFKVIRDNPKFKRVLTSSGTGTDLDVTLQAVKE